LRDRYSAFRRLMAVWLQHATFLKLLCRERDEQRWLFSCFFIRTGSNAFPESVRARRAQRFIHHRSQLHRLFIWLRRPTSEARPIKCSHSCPDACRLARINPNAPSPSLSLALSLSLSVFLSSHLSLFIGLSLFALPTPLPSVAPSLFSPLMRSEPVFFWRRWCDPRGSKLQIKRTLFRGSPPKRSERGCAGRLRCGLHRATLSCQFSRINRTLECNRRFNKTFRLNPQVTGTPNNQWEQRWSSSALKQNISGSYSSPPPLPRPRTGMPCSVCRAGGPDQRLTMLTVRFTLGTVLMPQSLFPPFIFISSI